jgi:hypothetical protein
MWRVMPYLSIGACQADAIFASELQRGDEPSAGQLSATPAVPDWWRRSSAIIPKRR